MSRRWAAPAPKLPMTMTPVIAADSRGEIKERGIWAPMDFSYGFSHGRLKPLLKRAPFAREAEANRKEILPNFTNRLCDKIGSVFAAARAVRYRASR